MTSERGAPMYLGTSTPAKQEQQDPHIMSVDDPTPPPVVQGSTEPQAEIIDIEDEGKTPAPPSQQQQDTTKSTRNSNNNVTTGTSTYPGGLTIDVCFEASKLPLDVAIFNSARAAGGDEKIRKYLQAVLVIGGTALIPGMGHALESRLEMETQTQSTTFPPTTNMLTGFLGFSFPDSKQSRHPLCQTWRKSR